MSTGRQWWGRLGQVGSLNYLGHSFSTLLWVFFATRQLGRVAKSHNLWVAPQNE